MSHIVARSFGQESFFRLLFTSGTTEIRPWDREGHPNSLHEPNWQCRSIYKISKPL